MGMAEHLRTMMVGDVSYAANDVSSTMRVGRRTVSGTSATIGSADQFDENGQLRTADIQFVAALDLFGDDLPAVRAIVEVDGVKYMVERVMNDGAVVEIDLRRG